MDKLCRKAIPAEDSLKMSKELWFHSQCWQRYFLLLWNIHISSTAHPASNSTGTGGNNLLPCCLLVIIYIKLICKIIQIKFPTVCISFILVSSLSMALTAAALQVACDRDGAELLIKCLTCCSTGECVILLLWQFRPDFHVGHIIHKSVLSCCMCCHIMIPSHMSCVFGADHTLSDRGFKEHCPTKFCSEIKSPRFLQVINYDITMQASIFAYPWQEKTSIVIG